MKKLKFSSCPVPLLAIIGVTAWTVTKRWSGEQREFHQFVDARLPPPFFGWYATFPFAAALAVFASVLPNLLFLALLFVRNIFVCKNVGLKMC